MKKLILLSLSMVLALAAGVFAQGNQEYDGPAKSPVGLVAPTSITNYTHTKAAVTIPVAKTVSKICISTSSAGTVQLNGAGGTKSLVANTDWCRGVRKGVTSVVFTGTSSAAKTITVEKEY